MNVALRGRCVNHVTNGPCIKDIIFLINFKCFLYLISIFGKNIIGEIMNNQEYDDLVKSIVKNENPLKNILIAFFSGGCVGLLTELIINILLKTFSITLNQAYFYSFAIWVFIGSLLTGLGFFDNLLSICKCGLIVPSTGFANSMTSSAMDTRFEGFIKGIGSSIFKLTGSIILYGIIFGIIFGFVRGVLL